MLVATGNRKRIFFFYFCLFFLLSTVNFSNSKNENKRIFFSINKIQINGNIRLDKNILLENLNKLYGQSIFKLNTDEIKTELFKFNLIKSIKIKKYSFRSIKSILMGI